MSEKHARGETKAEDGSGAHHKHRKLDRSPMFHIEALKDDAAHLHTWTGAPNYEEFGKLHDEIGKENLNSLLPLSVNLSSFDTLAMILIRLHRGLEEELLATLFGVTESSVGEAYGKGVVLIAEKLFHHVHFLSDEELAKRTPDIIKEKVKFSFGPNFRAAAFVYVVFAQKSRSWHTEVKDLPKHVVPEHHEHDKHTLTKCLIVAAPNGHVLHMSHLYPAHVTDQQLWEFSNADVETVNNVPVKDAQGNTIPRFKDTDVIFFDSSFDPKVSATNAVNIHPEVCEEADKLDISRQIRFNVKATHSIIRYEKELTRTIPSKHWDIAFKELLCAACLSNKWIV